MTKINLAFKGYYPPTDPNISSSTGIYCIYETQFVPIPSYISSIKWTESDFNA